MSESESTDKALPYEGQLHASPNPLFKETVILVPFFGGSQQSMRRHVQYLNSIGYNCVTFDLKCEPFNLQDLPIASNFAFGLKAIWADQVERILNCFAGPKIVFSFSNPCSGAIEAIARRSASDISGLICDSGPSAEPFVSIYNYFKKENPSQILLLRLLQTSLSTITFGPKFVDEIHQNLKSLPDHFKLLSIRGWKDKLITPAQIDKIFEPHLNLDWRKLSLPEAEHLNGLKDFAEDYTQQLHKFLTEISTKIA